MSFKAPLAERFERQFIPEPTSGCWLWAGAVNPRTGYGVIGRGAKTAGIITTHRLSWMLYRGAIPDGLLVLHKCDVRSCVNPDHLFLGTYADNNADMRAKGRAGDLRVFGEQHGNAKFTNAQVRDIKAQLLAGARGVDLARAHGVTKSAINCIKQGKTWRHL